MLNLVLQAVSGVAGKYMETRKVKAEAKAAIDTAQVKARIAQIERQASAEVDYDIEAMRQTQYSWKDEVALVVILAPFVGSFLPWTQEYVAQGWIHLNQHAPDWYSYVFMASIAASMGIRWAVTQFGARKR